VSHRKETRMQSQGFTSSMRRSWMNDISHMETREQSKREKRKIMLSVFETWCRAGSMLGKKRAKKAKM
jgi:hypothetical protein